MKKTILGYLYRLLYAWMVMVAIFTYGGKVGGKLSFVGTVYAQGSPSVQQNISGMFNERGYSTSNSSSHDENEIINDFNGNLQYSIPMYNIKGPGDMSLNMSVNYNSNIAYNFIPAYLQYAYEGDPLPLNNVNAPGWIISVNGIAVQMTNFETNLLTQSTVGSTVTDDNVRLLAQGYHLTDKKYNPIEEKDIISILMGDGTVLRLENISPNSYIGDYYSTNKGIYAKAKVRYKDGSEDMWDYCKNRWIELQMGDGLTYRFEEKNIEYFDFHEDDIVEDGCANRPQVIKLDRITDRFGNYIQCWYDFPSGERQGREPLDEIDLSWTSTNTDINIDYFFMASQGKIKLENTEQGNYELETGGFNLDSSGTHRTYINRITNPLKKTINIGYESYQRKLENLKNSGDDVFTAHLGSNPFNLKRMVSFTNYNGGKREYDYIDVNYALDMSNSANGGVYGTSGVHYGHGRDAFFTNILKEKITKDKGSNDSLKIETFSYSFSDGGGTSPINHSINYDPIDTTDTYITTKTVTTKVNNYNETPSSFNWVKYYKNYQTYAKGYNREFADWPGEVKIYKEEHKKGATLFKTIDYNFIKNPFQGEGEIFHKGPLVDTSVTETIDGVSRTTRFKYSHFQSYPYTGGDTANNPIQTKIEIDPLGNKTETSFKKMDGYSKFYIGAHFNGGSQTRDSAFIFVSGQPEYIKKFNKSGNLLYHEAYEYFDNNTINEGYIFQLKKKKIINPSQPTDMKITEFEYYKNDTTGVHLYDDDLEIKPSPEGQLEKVKDPMNNISRFYYHPVVINEEDRGLINIVSNKPEIKFKKLFDNGSIVTEDTLWEDRRMPVRTDVYSGSGKYNSVYTQYDAAGNMTKIFDKNNYLNEFKFDKIDRVISANAPYDFNSGTDTSFYIYDTTFVPFTDTIRSVGWGSKNMMAPYNYTYTEFNGLYTVANPMQMYYYQEGGAPDNPTGDMKVLPVIKFDTIKSGRISRIDTAYLFFTPTHFKSIINGNVSDAYELQIKPFGSVSSNLTMANFGSATDYPNVLADTSQQPGTCDNYETRYDRDYLNKVNVTASLKNHFETNNRAFEGFLLDIGPTGNPVDPELQFIMHLTKCIGTPRPDKILPPSWGSHYSPILFVRGEYRIIDSSLVTIPKPSTLRYIYNDAQNKVTTFGKLSGSTFKKNEVLFDGFYRVNETRQFTGTHSFNKFKTEYNYLDQTSKSTDAEGNLTKLSYNEWGGVSRSDNPDSSYTRDTVTFLDNLITAIDTISGFVKKERFTDETGRFFDKYFDAAGNLVRESKFLDAPNYTPEDPEMGDSPLITELATDYIYDDLYRVIKVRTPAGKVITYAYDGFGRQVQRNTVDAGIEKFWYDNNDNLVFSQDAKQKAVGTDVFTERQYDGLKRLLLIGETVISGSQPDFDNLRDGDTLFTDNLTTSEYLVANVYDTLTNAPGGITFTAPSGFNDITNNTKGQLVATAFRTNKTDPWNFKFYRYDARGRVIRMWVKIDGLPEKKIDYAYNSQNQQVKLNYQPAGTDNKIFSNGYDSAGRLSEVSFFDLEEYNDSTDTPANYTNLVSYGYDSNSSIKDHDMDDGAITNNISYTKRNWIQQTDNSFFRYALSYLKNGNVLTQHLTGTYDDNLKNNDNLNFAYSYDRSNRLLKQDYTNGSDNTFTVKNSYDMDGNILTLERYGANNDLIDDFFYDYYPGKNRLASVNPNIETPLFQYDSSGNVKNDYLNQIINIKYDHRNLLTEYSKVVNDTSYATRYYYDEAGNRIKKVLLRQFVIPSEPITPDWSELEEIPGYDAEEIFFPVDGPDGPIPPTYGGWRVMKTEYYIRGVDGKELAIYNGNSLDLWNIWGLDNVGKIEDDGSSFFYMKDHLGSIHAVIDENQTVVSTQDYDIWGHFLEDRTSEPVNTTYDFTGKQRDVETGYDYFGARYYDSKIARWGGVDKMNSKKPGMTPYQYCALNPLKLIDPTGEDEIEVIVRTYISDKYSFWPSPAGLMIGIHDGRGAEYNSKSYRTEQRLVIETDPNIRYEPKVSYKGTLGVSRFSHIYLFPFGVEFQKNAEGDLPDPLVERTWDESEIKFTLKGNARETLIKLPEIDYEMHFTLSQDKNTVTLNGFGTEDGFPSYEIWIRNLTTNSEPKLMYDSGPRSVTEIFKLTDGIKDTKIK